MPLGEGDVGMERYLRTLDKLGYRGPLTIEREIPQEPERQKAEIGRALALLRRVEAKDRLSRPNPPPHRHVPRLRLSTAPVR